MYQYRITKYDPQNRVDGKYIKDEWTSYSDIGQPFSGMVLTMEDYLETEQGYIQCVMDLLAICDIGKLSIEALELHDKLAKKRWKHNRALDWFEISDFMRDCLRRRCWARLTADRFFVHFGHEYYMYVGCEKPIGIVAPIAEKNHLFCEDFKSPYHRRLE